jgi:hypothetical protein
MTSAYHLLEDYDPDPPPVSFEDQFTDEGANIVYRYANVGLPIMISSRERDIFIADFRKKRRVYWLCLAAWLVAALCGASFWLAPDIWAIFIVAMALFIPVSHVFAAWHQRIFQAPEIARFGDASERARRSRSALRMSEAKRQPWWSIVTSLPIPPVLVIDRSRPDTMITDIALAAIAVFIILKAAHDTYWKLRARYASPLPNLS